MSTSELEDLAAAAGIVITQDSTDDPAVSESTPVFCEATEEKATSEATERQATAQNENSGEPSTFPPDILSMCSEDRLEELNAEFADRYTSADEEYTCTLKSATLPPPCVTGWWSSDRNFDRSRDRRGGRGHWDRGRGYWGRGGGGRGGGDYRDRGGYQERHYHDNRYDRYHGNQGHYHQRDRDQRQYRDRSPDRRYR